MGLVETFVLVLIICLVSGIVMAYNIKEKGGGTDSASEEPPRVVITQEAPGAFDSFKKDKKEK